MTDLEQFSSIPCPTIDPLKIDAYFTLGLDSVNSSVLKLDTSWGCTSVDLTPAVQAAETITHLFITPEGSLQYNREDYGRDGVEDGGVDCITGDELSRIISTRLLKDVDQTQQIKDGMVYMWDGISNLFEPWDLKTFAQNTNDTLEQHQSILNVHQAAITNLQTQVENLTKRVSNLETRMTNVENRLTVVEADITDLKQRLSDIEGAIYNWPADKTTKIARGSINVYGGTTQSVNTSRGIYTHNPNTNVIGDCYFAA